MKGKARKCPHCGGQLANKLQIVSVVDNASDLQREVAAANMPDSLKKELEDRLPDGIELNKAPSASQLMSCIRIAAVDDVVTLERLGGALRGKGIRIDSEDVAEEGISQGLLMRSGDNEFILLQ